MENIHQEKYTVSSQQRAKQKNQQPLLIWFTGLSGSGKSTLAKLLDKQLFDLGYHTYSLDGDNIRSGLNNNLHFSPEDRKENLRRVGEVANLFLDAGIVCVAAFISPYEADRKAIEKTVGSDKYFEIFVDTPLEVCEERDVKGLYAKARAGEIKDFTGINAPYEKPQNPAITIDTSQVDLETAMKDIIQKILLKITA